MKIDATTFAKLPEHLKALFDKAPNPGRDEVVAGFPGEADGSAARFFYCAKASREDRNEGLDNAPQKTAGVGDERPSGSFNERLGKTPTAPRANHLPTVKPTELMRWLVRLVAPSNGLVLDPFMGSGSTGKACVLEGRKFIGIDLNPEYIAIARARIEFSMKQGYQSSLLEAA